MKAFRARSRAGSLLIICLWIVSLLSMVAIAISRHLSREIYLVKFRKTRVEVEAMARAGVYLTMAVLEQDETPGYDWLGDYWAVKKEAELYPGLTVSQLEISDVESKLDLNKAAAIYFEYLTQSLDIGTAIVDYRDEPDIGEENTSAQPPYYPKNGPFVHLDELYEIDGLSQNRGAFDLLMEYTGVAPHDLPEQVNINYNTASQKVFLSIARDSQLAPLFSLLEVGRAGINQELGDDDDCFAKDKQFIAAQLGGCIPGLDQNELAAYVLRWGGGVSSSNFIMHIQARSENPDVRASVEARVYRDPSDGAVKLINWKAY